MNGLKVSTINWGLLITTLLVGGVGLVNLHSTAREASTNLAAVQGLWIGVGLILALVLTVIDYRIFEQLAYPVLIVSLVLLLLVLVISQVRHGSQRWIDLGFFNLQPSEAVKVAVVLAIAKYFADEPAWPVGGYSLLQLIKPATILYPVGAAGSLILFWEHMELGNWRFLLLGICLVWAAGCFLLGLRTGRTSLHDILSPVILLLLPAVLILRQPDLGTTLILCAIAGTMFLFVKVRWTSLLIILVGMGAVVSVLLVAATSESIDVLEKHQKKRILAFFYPEKASKDDRWQAYQSEIAVGSGQTWGKGYMKSTQTQFRFLPEQQTDFVFSVWAEEWGFAGSLAALGLFLFWMIQIINAVSLARDRFGALVAVGVCAMVLWHMVVNLGMVLGLMPVVGLTLPLWSYGGSSVLVTMVGIGLLMSISTRRPVI